MNLNIKNGKRNLQSLYDELMAKYRQNLINEMKEVSNTFIDEMRTTKEKTYSFKQTVDKSNNRDKLLMFITNLHMQDSKETAGLSRI